jgi:hypothetical protein
MISKNRIKAHTIEQPDSDITTFVLSCNRLDVLEKTLQSFLTTKEYITKMVIVDDSAEEGIFETLVERYGNIADVICFPKNRSQWWAMDFMVSYCDTDYIFYLEDDWEFLQSGYLEKSKKILEKYRDIGTVDLSLRTFEWQGIDSYDKTLIDEEFYYKKLWRISDYHLQWYGWIGSPNLKRRDDLILLGRVEKWHNEWNIDRKFLGLGFKAVFLKDKYVEHLGDNCSRMAGKRPNDGTTPENYYPVELLKNRTYPKFDYLQWDKHWRPVTDITLVTALVDLERTDRSFSHYIQGISHILNSRHPIVVYCPEKYFSEIKTLRGDRPITLKKFDIDDIEGAQFFNKIQNIIQQESWYNQAEWMKDSVIKSKHYIPLTLLKQVLLEDSIDDTSSYYYWIDSGIYNSYNITEPLDTFYFTKIPKDKFFITSFNYRTDTEIHGYDIKEYIRRFTHQPGFVCRATLFGGTKEQIIEMTNLFYTELKNSIDAGFIGTEESIYTILSLQFPDKFNRYLMQSGDIKNYLNTLR